jgi:tripartite-type tricarboxylate transporter receptor subunit TctC
MGIGVHKNVPPEQLKILREAFAKAYNDKTFQDIMTKTNVPAKLIDGDEFGKLCSDGYKESEKNLKAMGAKK